MPSMNPFKSIEQKSQMVKPLFEDKLYFKQFGDKEIELNKLYKINVSNDDATLSKDLKDDIAFYMSYIASTSDLWRTDECDVAKQKILKEFDWRYKTDRGTFNTRISAYLKKTYNKELNSVYMNEISRRLNNDILKTGEYYFDIDLSLDWNKGEFGDYSSCFFSGENPGQRFDTLRKAQGYYALRFFKKFNINAFPKNAIEFLRNNFPYSFYVEGNNIYRGYARCWLRYGFGVTYPVLSNSYGHGNKVSAHILSAFLGEEAKIRNVSVSNTEIYNNGDAIEIHPKSVGRDSMSSINCAWKEGAEFKTSEKWAERANELANLIDDETFKGGFRVDDTKIIKLNIDKSAPIHEIVKVMGLTPDQGVFVQRGEQDLVNTTYMEKTYGRPDSYIIDDEEYDLAA